jgi:glycosyltransferase involved in cell wall biosynthesis
MHITFYYPKPIPVRKYGGIQRITFWLMKYLVKKGHRVSLIGHRNSDVEKIGVHLIASDNRQWHTIIPNNTDVVMLFHTPVQNIDFPIVINIGGNGKRNEIFHKNTIFVSKKHAHLHHAVDYIYNGIDLEEYPEKKSTIQEIRAGDWYHFLFLAKANWPVKNLDQCISACVHTKKHLHIAGGKFFSLSPYVHSYGMVDQKKKIKLLQRTDALLFPVRWHEPFGLAIIEAMALGLPVIGSPYGSLPELITPENGIICNDFSSFKRAVEYVPVSFNPQKIRKYVATNFSADKMADEYLFRYEKVIKGEYLQPETPITYEDLSGKNLLPF